LVVYSSSADSSPLLSIPLYGYADAPVAAMSPYPAIVLNTAGPDTISPLAIALDGAGNIYVANAGGGVVKMPAGGGSGSLLSVFGNPLPAATGVAIDGAGNLFIADEVHSQIVVLTPAGTTSVLAITGLSAGLVNPGALTFDPGGNLYIADTGNARVVKVSSLAVQGVTTTGLGTVLSTGDFTLGPVTGVGVDPAGNTFIADPGNDRVLEILASGAASVLLPSGITFSNPQGVGVDPMGNVYVADSGNNRVVEVTSAGAASVESTPGLANPASLSGPAGVAVDPTGDIFIADSNNNRVIEVLAAEASLVFPHTRVGLKSAAQDATILNLGNQPLVFAASADVPANFAENSSDPNLCTPATQLAPGSSCDVSVLFAPHSKGTLNANLTRRTNSLNISNSTQQIQLVGMASDPADTTATSVAGSPSSVTFGQATTLTATVTDTTTPSSVPTGQVMFTDTVGSTLTSLNNGLGVNLNGAGQAVLTGVILRGVGTHTITAVYGGMSNSFNSSTGTTTVSLNQAAVTLTLQPATSYVFGQAGGITATVSGPYTTVPPPSGNLTYSISNSANSVVASGTLSLAAGTTSSTSTIPLAGTLPPGGYTVSVTYSGDSNYLPSSTPSTLALNIIKASPTVSLVSSLNPVLATNPVTLTASVTSSSGNPTGSVNFYDGQTLLTSATLTAGAAAYTTSGLAIGTHSITAYYTGDTNFSAVTSAVVAQLVVDFTLTASIPVGQPNPPVVLPGNSTAYTIQVAATRGANFPSPVTLAISGLPAGATATFAPATVAAGSPATNVTLTVSLGQQIVAQSRTHPLTGRLALALAGVSFLAPFVRKRRRAGRAGPLACLLLLVAIASAALGLTACGSSRSGYFGQQEVTYTMTVTATSSALSHTTTVAITVE
jgi:hypothetical protein